MLTPKEHPHYNAQEGFDWNKIVGLIYSEKGPKTSQNMAKTKKS